MNKNPIMWAIVCIGLVGLLGVTVLRVLDQPLAHINERGECVYIVVIENDHERAIKCPVNWKEGKYQVTPVPSDEVLEEFSQHFSAGNDKKLETKEMLKALKVELEKRARIAKQE